MAVTVEQLKAELKEYNYETLTGGDDSIAERCLAKATIWIKAKVRKCGLEFDPDCEIEQEALIKRALYELYSFAENEELAKDKKQDAIDLLRAYHGNCVDKGESEKETQSGDPVVYVEPGTDNWKGYS